MNDIKLQNLISKLSLDSFFANFSTYISRISPSMDYSLNTSMREKLRMLIFNFNDNILFPALPKLPAINNLNKEILWLKKGANLTIQEIFTLTQLVKSIYDLSKLCENDYKDSESALKQEFYSYFKSFHFPPAIIPLLDYFDLEKRIIKRGVDKELDTLQDSLQYRLKEKELKLQEALSSAALQEYLVDTQIHFIQNDTALLARAGFSNVLQARVIERSSKGFFYIIPTTLDSLQVQIDRIKDGIEEQISLLAAKYSEIYRGNTAFLKYLDSEFSVIDNAIARVAFARDYSLSFMLDNSIDSNIKLANYKHPSIKKPKPISIDFSKNLLIITGVNAGGKTMLLKSILSAALCYKYLLPLSIDTHKSHIPLIDNIEIISQDPQDSTQDISTFSGRIIEFSKILNNGCKNLIVGIDEIERGTDASEAASLYKVLLDSLIHHAKIVVTTHHKHLAALMAENKATQLLAALYDVKAAKPAYEFIDGIGKSYAMECAAFYGIPQRLINKAKALHSSEANKLENLINTSNEQITKNKQRELELESLLEKEKEKLKRLEEKELELHKEFEKKRLELNRHYNEAIKEIKMLARKTNIDLPKQKENLKEIHKTLNKRHKEDKNTPNLAIKNNKSFSIGDSVKYHNSNAIIIGKDNNSYTIELENGVRLKSIKDIELKTNRDKKPKSDIKHSVIMESNRATHKLDLHGYTAEEATLAMEDFFSRALIARFQEVVIVHGMGSGVLQKIVVEYLKSASFVRGYVNAPMDMGGMGAKIVYLC